MMETSSCDGSVMRSWKDLVKVNGSFYCNMSQSVETELELSPPPSPLALTKTLSATEQLELQSNWMTINEPIYVNSNASVHLSNGSNRTILRIGDQVLRQPSPVELTDVESSEFSAASAASCHTIKLVIGEPLSLDTSEYVSWDGSQTEATASADDDHDGEDSGSDDGHLQDDCLPPTSPARPLSAVDTVNDELTHSCCRFFDQRQQKLSSSFVSTTWNPKIPSTPEAATLVPAESTVKSPVPGINAKMEHLRMEIVSLVNQDDALFRQLLALNTSIHQLRSQSLQRRARSQLKYTSAMSPTLSASLASLTSLTSLSDGEDAEVEGDDSDPDPKNKIIGGQSMTEHKISTITVQTSAVNNHKPVAPHQQTLTRKRVSYPPKSRNRSSTNNSQLSRCSFNSSSSSSSSCSTSSGGSPTWSLSSADAKAIVKGVKAPRSSKTPSSPHSSFYSKSPTKHPQLSTKQRKHADLLMVFHKRQGSYDSGCQGSEPSDAEVFV